MGGTPQDGRGRYGVRRATVLAEANDGSARDRSPASELMRRPAMRRIGRLFRHHRQPGARASRAMLVRHGGTSILSETTGDLRRRASAHPPRRQPRGRREAGRADALVGGVHRASTAREINTNPSPGNKAGGLTTILEKSLGAMAKAGSTNLVEVYDYAEPVTAKGFVFMDTPGYDPVSATGLVAGGANLICFTTGRGSRVRLQAGALDQDRHQYAALPAHGGRHGRELRHDP